MKERTPNLLTEHHDSATLSLRAIVDYLPLLLYAAYSTDAVWPTNQHG
jgi:hypothetical protein